MLLITALAITRLGLLPASADGPHSSLEARIMPAVLHASIVRHASGETNPVPLNEDNLKAGINTYKTMCARGHSAPGGNPSLYGQSFYPPAPQLPARMYPYTEGQLLLVIKHRITKQGKPAL